MSKEETAKKLLQEWVDQQGHNRCWYYPDIFKKLCEVFEVECSTMPNLPPREEFELGCKKYQQEEYKQQN